MNANTRYQLRKGGWLISSTLSKLDRAQVQALRGGREDLARKIHVATTVLADVANELNPHALTANKVLKPIEGEIDAPRQG